ncbi:PQQ-binding-like beta-propeller repeat protein [uncultured Draconibacterium sp.]|uniref:outer membrane protein assembly factor BamB family protein n=1 Tax=uncultured Draconibacterium sp. TaxID=1573823 RepID=UPI0029C96769|nr:PQQ-binding-like beta-propeller repeat protein [uncultured Draconibacterium sp.]
MKSTLTLIAIFVAFNLFGQDLIEFRGVDRSGYYPETGLLKQWPETGPELLLKIEGVGKGFSAPIVANSTIYVTGIKEDSIDILSAFNFKAELLWDIPYGRSWTRSYIDSRSTPTYSDGNIYVSSGTGQLACVDAQTGKLIWKVDAVQKYAGEIHRHGDAEAPLVVGDLVAYLVGGEENTMVAFNKYTGEEVWKSKSLGGAKSYASPSLIVYNNRKIILAQTTDNLIGINAENGEILWSYNLIQYHVKSQGVGGNTNPPLYHNGEIFVTSGYDHPGLMFSLSDDGNEIELKWKNETLDNHHGGVVLVDGNIYGANWQHNAKGKWVSVNWESGRTNWETEFVNKGSIITADNMLYLYEEKRGNVALAEPSANELKIVSSFTIEEGAGPHWAHPAIYNGKLFIRHGNVLMIYNISE